MRRRQAGRCGPRPTRLSKQRFLQRTLAAGRNAVHQFTSIGVPFSASISSSTTTLRPSIGHRKAPTRLRWRVPDVRNTSQTKTPRPIGPTTRITVRARSSRLTAGPSLRKVSARPERLAGGQASPAADVADEGAGRMSRPMQEHDCLPRPEGCEP